MNVPITDKIQSVFPPQLFSYIYTSADKTLDVLSEPKNVAIMATAVFGVYVTYRHVNGNLKEKSFPDFPGATWYKDHRVMMRKTNSAGQFMKIVNKLGIPAGYIRFHFQKVLAVCDLNYAKEIFLTHGTASSGRRGGINLHLDHVASRTGVLYSTGDAWKNNRRIFLNFLRQWGKENQIDLILEESKFLMEAIEGVDGDFEPSDLLQKAVCNVISTFIFGARMEYSDPKIDQVFASLHMLNQRAQYLPEFFMRFMCRFPVFAWVKNRKEAINITRRYIREKIDALMDTGCRNPPQTLVEAYAIEKPGLVQARDEQEMEALICLILELFFAGTETTSTSMQWALACLAANPEIQQKMFSEIESVLGNADPTSKHLKELPYTTAVQLETQRFGCIAQNIIPHIMLDDVKLNCGKEVKKGETVLASLSWIMRDKKHWKQPESFCPENFLDENGTLVPNEAFVPYGFGARICLGQQLADLELKIFIIQLVRKFFIVSDDKIDLTDVVQKVTCSPKLYNYKFVAR